MSQEINEQILSDWKEDNEELYSKFRNDLEEQLQKPYHQTILDIGDDCAEPLKSVIACIESVSHNGSEDIVGAIYSRAVENDDSTAYCLCCYILFDDGIDHLGHALVEKSNESGAGEIIDAIGEYKRFYNRNKHQEAKVVTSEVLNLLTLRRWHYDHPEEYTDFLSTFQKAYEGDMTFINNNFNFLMEFLSFKGVKGMVKTLASMFPGNKHHEESLFSPEMNPLKGSFAKALDDTLNNDAIHERLLHKNPYLLSLYYWIVFDNGFLHAADLISQTFIKPDSPFFMKTVGHRAVEALISTSVDKAHYSKAQWKEMTKKLKKGEARQVIDAALLEMRGHKGRKSTYVLLEEMLLQEHTTVLVENIKKELYDWKKVDETDTILAYIFAALVKGGLVNDTYNYRTFHAAMREKFPDCHINKGFDWAEAIYNAIAYKGSDGNANLSNDQIARGKRWADNIKFRLFSAVNPNII